MSSLRKEGRCNLGHAWYDLPCLPSPCPALDNTSKRYEHSIFSTDYVDIDKVYSHIVACSSAFGFIHCERICMAIGADSIRSTDWANTEKVHCRSFEKKRHGY